MTFLKVDNKILEKYYELWLEGKELSDIQKQLELDDKTFNDYTPAFLNYCRHHLKHNIRDNLSGADAPDVPQLTPERRAKFIEYVSLGLSYDKVSKIMNIPLITIMDFWFKENPDFKAEAEYAIDLLDAEITMSLVKRAKGFKTQSKTTTTVEGNNEKGEVKTTTTSETEKEFAGDVGAQKFWLINKQSDHFSVDGEVNRKGNKGKILEAIDELIGDDAEDKLDEKYEEG
jgi:hypothetical protein